MYVFVVTYLLFQPSEHLLGCMPMGQLTSMDCGAAGWTGDAGVGRLLWQRVNSVCLSYWKFLSYCDISVIRHYDGRRCLGPRLNPVKMPKKSLRCIVEVTINSVSYDLDAFRNTQI